MANQKLTDEELATIKQLQERNDAVVKEFGQISLLQMGLEKRSENAKEYLEQLRAQEEAFGKELTEKYGSGTINMDTQEFIATPEAE